MYEQLIESIHAEANRLSKTQRSSIDALQKIQDEKGTAFNFSTSIIEEDRSVSDLDSLTSTMAKFAQGIYEDRNLEFVPKKWIVGFNEALKNTSNSFDALGNSIATIDGQHGGPATIDPAAYSVTTKNNTVIDLKKLLASINVNLDDAFAAYFQLRPAISAPRLSEFGELFSFFSSRRAELDSLSRELSRLRAQSTAAASAIDEADKSAKQNLKDIEKLKGDTTNRQAEIQSAATDAATKVTAINESHRAAEQLRGAVNNYQGTFDQFQKDLDTRNQDYQTKKLAFEKLKSQLDEAEQRISQINTRADDMLVGATNAGLAGSYSKKQIDIEKEIRKARGAYYLSIGLLVFLTLPIFIYSFPKEFAAEIFKLIFNLEMPTILARDTTQPELQQVLNFVARAVFLIPGLMFVRFTSSRHERLFRLREDYAYKYSIASSVEGFMKQSKAYADDIAAACYFELTYNPAERMDGSAEDARMLNPLFEKMLTRLEARMSKIRKPKDTTAAPAPNKA